MKNFFENFFGSNSENIDTVASSNAVPPPHNDLDNLDSLTSQQINELYDDVYIDSFQNDRIARKCLASDTTCSHGGK